RSALRGLSNPSRWRFLVKNSETEISRCRAPISIAETVVAGLAGFASTTSASATFGSRAFALGLGLALGFFLGFALAIAIISRRQRTARGYPTRRGSPASERPSRRRAARRRPRATRPRAGCRAEGRAPSRRSCHQAARRRARGRRRRSPREAR